MDSNKLSLVNSGNGNKIKENEDSPENQIISLHNISKKAKSTISLVAEENEVLLVQNDLQIDKLSSVTTTGHAEEVNEKSPTVSCTEIKRKGWRRYIGIIFAIIASVLFALASLIVKILTKDYHPITIAVWRFQGIFWPSLIVLLYCAIIRKEDVLEAFKPINDPLKRLLGPLLLCRGTFGMMAVILQFYSLSLLEMGDSTVIAFSTPVFVTFVAYLLLGESCGITPVLCALLTFCGVCVISRPPILTGEEEFNKEILIGATVAFCSMICSTMVFVLLRRIRAIHPAVITTFFGFFSSVFCLLATTIIHPFEFPQGREHWLLGIALALLTFVAHGSITLALKFEQAGPVSLIRTCDVIFAFLWQGIFLSVIPDKYSLLGAFIVVTGVLISGLRKWVGDLPENHATRLKLSFLLS